LHVKNIRIGRTHSRLCSYMHCEKDKEKLKSCPVDVQAVPDNGNRVSSWI